MSLEAGPERHGVRVVRATGEVDVVSASALEEQLPAEGALVLDLSATTFFDSAGVRLVHRLARAHADRGHGFRVVAPPGGRARRVLDLVGFTEVVSDDLDTAVAGVSAAP